MFKTLVVTEIETFKTLVVTEIVQEKFFGNFKLTSLTFIQKTKNIVLVISILKSGIQKTKNIELVRSK